MEQNQSTFDLYQKYDFFNDRAEKVGVERVKSS